MSYHIIYEHDDNGSPLDGSKEKLITLVSCGANLKIVMHDVAPKTPFLTILTPGFVTAQYGEINAQAFMVGTEFKETNHDVMQFTDPHAGWFLNLSTSGYVDRRVMVNARQIKRELYRTGMKWLVDNT